MLYFITGNEGKFREMQREIPELEWLSIDLPEIQSLDPREIVRAKLLAARDYHDGDLLVEDVSFHLDALHDLPGPFVKYFLKKLGPEGLARIAERLGSDGAEAVCTIGLLCGDRTEFFEGRVRGRIVRPRGSQEFGWDPIFQPAGERRTFGELSQEEKNAISHRGLAVRKLKAFLEG